jgi:hypothetical protein
MKMNIQERMGTMNNILMKRIVFVFKIIDKITQHKKKNPADE